MGAPGRIRVGRLAVRAPGRDAVPGFRADLEDAFRTLTLPHEEAGGLLVVRRLDLGRVPRGISRQALSQLVARRLCEAGLLRVPPGRALPGAAAETAGAVLFADQVTAAAAALGALCADRPFSWPLRRAFPGAVEGGRAERAAAVFAALAARAGPQAAGRLADLPGGPELLLESLEMAGPAALGRILAACAGEEARRAVEAAAMDRFRPRAAAPSSLPPGRALPSAAAPVPEPAAILPAWAEALVLPLLRGAAQPGGIELAAAALRLRAANMPLPMIAAALRQIPDLAARRRRGRASTRPGAAAKPAPGAPRSQGTAGAAVPEVARTDPGRAAVPDRAELLPGPVFDGEESPVAGLWLLLAAMRLAGLERAEAAGVPLCLPVLRGFAARLGLGEGDPSTAAIGTGDWDPPAEPALGRSWGPDPRLLPAWRGWGLAPGGPGWRRLCLRGFAVGALRPGTLRRHGGPGLRRAGPVRGSAVTGAMLSAQCAVSAATGMGWRPLARLPGRICVTPTHVDVTYDARDLRLPVRLAGFDLNPGWVPWLGRVVSFHYDYSQLRDHDRAGGAGRRP
ncbi:hypothetical protein [Poseidonocella sp. HB161398]|uniref:hypothetical protein n=1 Tax=Poseidonocella sp. HB161398 TaxID=2320855 RepID=UPI0011094334|nr:hypothetical protein [Poseidonocella sp. HB161398]